MTREKIRFYIETLQNAAFLLACAVIIEVLAFLRLKGPKSAVFPLISMGIGIVILVLAIYEYRKIKDYPDIDHLSEEAQDFFWTACRKKQTRLAAFGGLWIVNTSNILWTMRRNPDFLQAQHTWDRIRYSGLWVSVLLMLPILSSSFFLMFIRMRSPQNSNHVKQTAAIFSAATFIYWFFVIRIQRLLVIAGHHWNFWLCAAVIYLGIILGVWCLDRDDWSLLPYVTMISAVGHRPYDIYIDAADNYCIQLPDDKDFKILQLTDIHLGGSRLCAYADQRALEAVYDLIRSQSPDFIVVTGDLVFALGIKSFSTNNYTPIAQFAALMRNIGIPWAFTYGNHDTEFVASHSTEEIHTLFHRLSYDKTFNLLYPKRQPDISGRSNQMIRILNKDQSLRQLLFLMDSNAYLGTRMKAYDCVHEDQIRWYEMMVQKEFFNAGHSVPSLMFMHMPLQAYKEAYEKYKAGSSEVTYHYGEIGERHEEICCSKQPCRLFDAILQHKSTKGIFVGHDHFNNISMTYKGVRLTYGLSIDYLAMPGIYKKEKQRGATLITVRADGTFESTPIYLKDINRKI